MSTQSIKLLHARSRRLAYGVACVGVTVVASCGGSGSDPGSLRLALTDAPACGYAQVNVTVQKVRVHQSSSAGENEAGWAEIVIPQPQRIDLLALNNGVLAELGQTSLAPGRYAQLRLVLAPNGNSAPFANSVVPIGGSEVALDTPSGSQSGLKLNIGIEVASNQRADAVLDFDACLSIVKRGGSGRYNLKPVMSVLPRSETGLRVEGFVTSGFASGGASVSAQKDGVIVRATHPGANGRFVLFPVPAGTYDLVVNVSGFATATITGVPSVNNGLTAVNVEAGAIGGPAAVVPSSAMTAVTGTVATGAAPIEALVQARKAYTGGPTVVVAISSADGDSGAYSLSLPRAAPVRAAYADAAASITFAAGAPADIYELSATAVGVTKTAPPIDLGSLPPGGTNFVFP